MRLVSAYSHCFVVGGGRTCLVGRYLGIGGGQVVSRAAEPKAGDANLLVIRGQQRAAAVTLACVDTLLTVSEVLGNEVSMTWKVK